MIFLLVFIIVNDNESGDCFYWYLSKKKLFYWHFVFCFFSFRFSLSLLLDLIDVYTYTQGQVALKSAVPMVLGGNETKHPFKYAAFT